MPKDISSRHLCLDRNRYHAYKEPPKPGKGHDVTEEDAAKSSPSKRDWEDATCSICMEFPHNAVLLYCSSHDKGCRPYMCNSSYRHSNCLDRYQKAQLGVRKELTRELLPESGRGDGMISGSQSNDSARTSPRSRRTAVTDPTVEAACYESDSGLVDLTDDFEQLGASSSHTKVDVNVLLCPLCRGKVNGWKVIQSARDHLNNKVRSCAQEACPFSGTYEELRVHARREHPFACPSEVDPARQRDWRRLERRRDLGDVMSTMMPGATVVGDFVIEDDLEEEQEAMDFPGDDGHWWTVFLLFQVFGPATSVVSDNASRTRSRLRVPRRGLWGESLPQSENMQIDSLAEDIDSSELLRRSARRRRRRAEG